MPTLGFVSAGWAVGANYNSPLLLDRPPLAMQPIQDNHVIIPIAMSVAATEAEIPVVHVGNHVTDAITDLKALVI